jgi:hypothetical protein
VLVAAKTATAGNAGTSEPTFDFASEPYSGTSGNTINTITVIHRNKSAKSRQTKQDGKPSGRIYPNGIYSFTDDMVMISGDRIRPADPNATSVRAWQYYVYDKDGNEAARGRNPGVERTIVPFDDNSAFKGYVLSDGSRVVLRLVTIFMRPTHDDLGEIAKTEYQATIRAY